MAKRKMLFHPDDVKEKIKTSQLINRLHQHAFGEIELTPQQVRSIEILLRKAVPDLAAIEHSGEMTIQHDITDEPLSADEWAKEHATAH